MPNVSITLTGTSQSVTRPILIDIISQVQEITKISKSSKVFFPGDSLKNITAGSELSSDGSRDAIFSSNRYTFIEIEEDYDVNTLGSTAVTRVEQNSVFIDNELKVYITPVYATTDTVINFRYRCPSKTEALRWRDDIRMRISMLRDINLHTITYHYPLPTEVIEILRAVYDNREAYLPYNETIQDYITNNSTERLTVLSDLANNDARLSIAETQCRIVGIYNFDGLPEKPERDDQTGTWSISFSYKFSYEKPIACNMKYPIIVHNKLLPAEYISDGASSYDLDLVHKRYNVSGSALSGFESDTIMNSKIDYRSLIRIPIFDDFLITNVPYGTGTALIALSEIDDTKPDELFNLRELGDIEIDPDILEFIALSEYPYLGHIYKSIINVSLYRNEFLTSSGTIICDSDLNIKSVIPLNLRQQHRVRLSLVVDLTLLNQAALDRLKKFPKAFIKIIGALNELLKNHPDFTNLGNKTYITANDFSPIYSMLTGFGYDNGASGKGGMYYGPGIGGNNWQYNQNNKWLFGDLDPRVIENYRKNAIKTNSTMVTGIAAIKISK